MFLFMRIDIKTTIILLLTIAVIVLSTCNSCKQKKIDKLTTQLEQCKSNDQSGTINTDTVYIHDTVSFYDHAPIPTQTEPPQMAIKRVFDTLYIQGIGEVDTVYVDTLINRFYSTNFYSKKYEHKYGTITTFDTTSQNKLLGSGLNIDLSLPIVTKTEYRPSKQKALFYIGIDAYGNKKDLLNGAGGNFTYLSKRALGYQIAAYFNDQIFTPDPNTRFNFRATILFPLNKK